MTSLGDATFSILPEVEDAIRTRKPVVALESTVITHGLPYPQNVSLANEMEAEIRKLGCIPATIAILDGNVCVGLDQRGIERLVEVKEPVKVSVRDIAPAIYRKSSGGTTVAGTLVIAAAAGIKVFATGGIGGVHRGQPFDISTDLMQLSRSRVVVVCAGAKAILDIPATLEVLETYGVPVVGYRTDTFPAFYSMSSGCKVSARMETAKDIASLASIHWNLGMETAILVGVPIPPEIALERDLVEKAVESGLEQAEKNGIRGQAVTPFLLSKVSDLTGGLSLKANLGLLLNNARLAGEIAIEISKNA